MTIIQSMGREKVQQQQQQQQRPMIMSPSLPPHEHIHVPIPLYPPPPPHIQTIQRRDNTHHHHNQYHKRAYNQYDPDNIMSDNNQAQAQVQVQVPSSPTLKWDGGVFREQQQGKFDPADVIGWGQTRTICR